MSYSFNVKAATKADAVTQAEQEFDKVVEGQPIHAKDRKAAMTAVGNVVDVLQDDPAREVSVSVSGYVSWSEGEAIHTANVSVTASLVS
jgi:hypothetical protein